MTKQIGIIHFSPTDTTKKICTSVASGMGASQKELTIFDITKPQTRKAIRIHGNDYFTDIDILIVGSPVHSGKLPVQVIESLQVLNGNGKEAVAIVVYGNRDYGIALHTMVGLLSENGFKINAAGAFIGQHSYSDILPIALGRPDASDLEKAAQLGVKSVSVSTHLDLNHIPVQHDKISKSDEYSAIKPVHNTKLCIQCTRCSKKCPIGLLSSETGRYVNSDAKKKCIGCMACVKACMSQAKTARVNLFVKLIMKHILKQAVQKRKDPLILVS